tara:strand:- start:13451 stop:13600 length:150 start_codon:yes stop_codon:yes gene_type:complete
MTDKKLQELIEKEDKRLKEEEAHRQDTYESDSELIGTDWNSEQDYGVIR